MDPARIAELLAPFVATPPTADRRPTIADALYLSISTYIDLLLRWNSRINLTAIRDPEQIVTRHFGESLFAARILFPPTAHVGRDYVGAAAPGCPAEDSAGDPANHQRRTANGRSSVADLGSGAGFPGIPIKLWAPRVSLALIESNHKKAAFLAEVTRALTLTDVNIKNARAETLPPRSFDLVTLRAVERFDKALPVAAALLAPGGTLALLIGSSQMPEAKSILPALSWSDPLPIPNSDSRILAVGHI
jgi:16S rRNA (guanine527-N7)-methyltransferase